MKILSCRLFLFFLLVTALSGCAPRYSVLTNAYLDPTARKAIAPGSSVVVLTNGAAPNPIFDKEVKAKIETLLGVQGYRVVPESAADFVLTYQYDITGRSETETRPEFVHGPDVVHQVYVTGSNAPYTVVSPGYSYVVHVSETYTVYAARLFVKAYDAAERREGKDNPVWVGDTLNESSNPDLRESIDYLLGATFRFLGKDTRKNQEVTLDSKDPAVASLRK